MTDRIHDIFQQSPTRKLEEVQKINAREQAENDVREFYETASARTVLETLGVLVDKYPHEEPRFLDISATFGSGKTHLLKLAGFAADMDSEFADLGEELATRWPGFKTFRQRVTSAHVDRLEPVFLNLLNRDASQEPPLPYLIYEAVGRHLGYPTDPNWLLEWAWQLDMEHGDAWEQLLDIEHDGQTFDEVYDERATLRSWLYQAVPQLADAPYASSADVKSSIDEAEAGVAPEAFDPDDLVERIVEAQDALSTPEVETELLIGLDELALFIGDGSHRYREFQRTMRALTDLTGPNPPVVGTGQYPIEAIHGEFEDTSVTEEPWHGRQVPLEGADSEIIVRKRWLQKDTDGERAVEAALERTPDLTLDIYENVGGSDPDAVEAYPFREYDLTLLRRVIQQLMPRGRVTEAEYVQGRALLILVRSLFTQFGWGEKPVGAVVTWDELFDLLVKETTYVPLWVREMIENKLVPSAGGDESARTVRVAKALYLLNQVRSVVPSTPANLARLMVDSVDASFEETHEKVEAALDELVDDRKALTETNDHGDVEYLLVSKEQEDILSRASARARQIASHRLSAKLESSLQDASRHLLTEGSRHEVDLDTERRVPLRYEYSVLDPVERASTPEFDAVRVRILADDAETVTEQVDAWQASNEGKAGGEHVLVAIEIPESTVERLRDVMGMAEILSEETESHPDIEADHHDEERALESTIRAALMEASIYVPTGSGRGRFDESYEQVIIDQVRSVFGGTRHVLTNGITEVPDAEDMGRFFRGSADWPLSEQDAEMLGVDLEQRTFVEGWCRSFLSDYDDHQTLRAEALLDQTVQRGGHYRGTPRESIAALLITLVAASEISLSRDGEFITDLGTVGRAVRNKTSLTDLQIRFDVVVDGDPERIRSVVTTLTGEEPARDDPDAWITTLATWIDEHSTAVKRTIRGVNREFDDAASMDELEAAIKPAFEGESLDAGDLGDEVIETQAKRFARARVLFEAEEGESLWARFSGRAKEMQRLHPSAAVTSRMQSALGGSDVPEADRLEQLLGEAEAHRRRVACEQYNHLTSEDPPDDSPEEITSALGEWLRDHEAHVRDIVDRIEAEFDGIELDALSDVFETAWSGDEIKEHDLVDSSTVQQTKGYLAGRKLLEPTEASGEVLWQQLRDRANLLESEYSGYPATERVNDLLGSTTPPSMDEVRACLGATEPPFELEQRLAELAEELRESYPNHEVTERVEAVLVGGGSQTEAEMIALVEEAEELLSEDDQLERLREMLDDLGDGSVVLIKSRD